MVALLWLVLMSGNVLSSVPKNTEEPLYLGKFKNTLYFLREESEFKDKPKNTKILTRKGNVIASVNSEYKRLLDIEGSGILLDGRVVSNAGTVGGIVRYQLSPFGNAGQTALGCATIPFRTIAVDKNKIKLGSVLYIKETDGMKMPDSTIHDGIWIATDIGGAIKGLRLDFFIGVRENADLMEAAKISHMKALNVFLLKNPDPKDTCGKNAY